MRPPRLSARIHDRVRRQRRRRGVRPDLEALEGRIVLSLVAASNADTQLNTVAAFDQTEPKVAMDASGDYAVVWNEHLGSALSFDYDVEVRIYDAATKTLSSSPIIIASDLGSDTKPSVAMDANGDFVVAWQVFDPNAGPPNYLGAFDQIEAQKFNLAGVAQFTSPITIGSNTVQKNQASLPQVAMDPAGDFVIAWQGVDSYAGYDSYSFGVFAHRYNASGTAQGSTIGVNKTTSGSQGSPAVAMDSSGNFVVAFDDDGEGANSGVYSQRYNNTGSLQGANTQISQSTTSSKQDSPASPSIAMEPTGQYVIAWQYQPSVGANQLIEAQAFGASGTATTISPVAVSSTATGQQEAPAVAVDDNGNYVVAWSVENSNNTTSTIAAQRINASGTLIGATGNGAQFAPSTQSGDYQEDADLASDPEGDTMIVWSSKPSESSDSNENAYDRLYNHINNAPTISTPSNVTINENAGQQTVNLSGISTGSGKESETLAVTASSNDTALINPTVTYTSANSTGTLTFTPAANSFGTATITLTVTDNGGTANGGVDTTSVQFTVTVNQVTINPTINTPSNLTINENAGQQTVNLTGITTNGAGSETLAVTASSNNSALVNPSVTYTSPNSTGTLTFTPTTDQFGTATITVTAKDSSGLTSVQFTVTVNQINVAPTINTPSNLTIDENAGQQTVNLTGIAAGGGATQTLAVSASSNNTALVNPGVTYTSPNSTGSLTFTPAANSFGTATITVTVTESSGGATGGVDSTSVQFTVTVNQINIAPTINTPSNATINENAGQQTVDLSGIAAGGGATQTLSVTVSSNNTALIDPQVTYTSPNSTGTLTFTPAANSFGTATITVTVTESSAGVSGGVNSTSVQFTVTVNQVAATVTAVSADWGTSGSSALQTASDGLRLQPAGLNPSATWNDLPWYGINTLKITLSQAESLSASDVSVTGIAVANYGPLTISGSGTNYTITFAQAITTADRVTVTIGNAGIATYTRRLDVLPGDVNDDGVVNGSDLIAVRNDFAVFGSTYDIFDDINGDGTVDVNDANIVGRFVGKKLPPMPPPA